MFDSIQPIMAGETMAQHYAAFPVLKNLILLSAGSQLSYSHIDQSLAGDASIQPFDWVETKAGEAVTQILSDNVEHNKRLVSGGWGNPGSRDSMFILIGTFTSGEDDGTSEGASILGFGDSNPYAREVVMGMQGNRPYALFKGTNDYEAGTLNTTAIPGPGDAISGYPKLLSKTETSLLCFIVRRNSSDTGNESISLVAIDDAAGEVEVIVPDHVDGSGRADFPETYSLGQNFIATGGFPDHAGSWKGLTAIATLSFRDGIPSTYLADLREMRDSFAINRPAMPRNWRGVNGGTDASSLFNNYFDIGTDGVTVHGYRRGAFGVLENDTINGVPIFEHTADTSNERLLVSMGAAGNEKIPNVDSLIYRHAGYSITIELVWGANSAEPLTYAMPDGDTIAAVIVAYFDDFTAYRRLYNIEVA